MARSRSARETARDLARRCRNDGLTSAAWAARLLTILLHMLANLAATVQAAIKVEWWS